jgi:hypothetical protein
LCWSPIGICWSSPSSFVACVSRSEYIFALERTGPEVLLFLTPNRFPVTAVSRPSVLKTTLQNCSPSACCSGIAQDWLFDSTTKTRYLSTVQQLLIFPQMHLCPKFSLENQRPCLLVPPQVFNSVGASHYTSCYFTGGKKRREFCRKSSCISSQDVKCF